MEYIYIGAEWKTNQYETHTDFFVEFLISYEIRIFLKAIILDSILQQKKKKSKLFFYLKQLLFKTLIGKVNDKSLFWYFQQQN